MPTFAARHLTKQKRRPGQFNWQVLFVGEIGYLIREPSRHVGAFDDHRNIACKWWKGLANAKQNPVYLFENSRALTQGKFGAFRKMWRCYFDIFNAR